MSPRTDLLRTLAVMASVPLANLPAAEPPHVEIEAKFIEMPDAIARELLPGGGQMTMLSEAELGALLRALNQKKGVDLLSAPRVTAKSGQNSTVEVIREFRYATEWEPPDQKTKLWTPTAFETKNVGVTLESTAKVKDDDTLDLHLVPQFVEFLGFVEPGTQKPIVEAKDDGRKSPVFATRKIATDLALRSGDAVLLPLAPVGETKPFVSAHAGHTLIAIVSARKVAPKGAAVPPAPPANRVPFALLVEGKPGFVISPFAPDAGYVDVRGYLFGTEVQDPFSGEIFRVP